VSFLREVLARLAGADVSFVVVGGVAVVLHGHMRATKDLDLVIDLEPAAARRALDVFTQMGLRPTAPVSVYDFADAAIRQSWIADKNMTVFQLYDPNDARNSVDLFADVPMDFEGLWGRAVLVTLDGVEVRVASIPDRVALDDAPRWPDARDDLARVVATTTPLQRLEWLEQMIDLAYESGALQKAVELERRERAAMFAQSASPSSS